MFDSDDGRDYRPGELPTRGRAQWVTGRLVTLFLLAALGLAGLGARVWQLTILNGPRYRELSENNYTYEVAVPAPRGRILTADGKVVALNRTAWDIEMSPFGLSGEVVRASLLELGRVTGGNFGRAAGGSGDIRVFERRADEVMALRPPWARLRLASNLTLDEVSRVLERQWSMPGIMIEPRHERHYPMGAVTAHLTGYLSGITGEEMKAKLAEGYLRADLIGRMGAERQFESLLRGTHGTEAQVRDAQGRPRITGISRPAVRGSDVFLTVDSRLQTAADRAMSGFKGVALAMDPRDGSVLLMVSKPDFDPEAPGRIGIGGTSSYNKAIRGRYAPASTFKVVTAAAGMARGGGGRARHNCNGRFFLPGHEIPYHCDARTGHGVLDLRQAIQRSCNVYFYEEARDAGADLMFDTARGFGFGAATGIDLMPPGYETTGLVGKPHGGTVYPGSVVHMGIGQGELILATPMQLLNAYAALANGGTLRRPRIFGGSREAGASAIERSEPETAGRLPLGGVERAEIIAGLRDVVIRPGGTAYGRGFAAHWEVAGKTGSAEVEGQESTNGLFACFAPASRPRIAVLVIVEGIGHGGDTAVPVTVEILRAFFESEGTLNLAAR